MVMRASLAGALVCVMAATLPAAAEPQASDLAGRWVSSLADAKEACGDAGCKVAYDLVPCGTGWCGIEVKDGKTCGRTALRLDAGVSAKVGLDFSGSFERAATAQPYIVKARLYAQPRGAAPVRLMLLVQGATDGTFQPLRRTYPMQMLLTRAGDAVCRGELKTS
jgi:hypothetical protein